MADSNKKIIYIVAAIVIIIFLGYLAFTIPRGEIQQVEKGDKVSYTGIALSQKIAEFFLGESQNADGSFQLSYNCDSSLDKRCEPKPLEGPLHGGQIILAFYDIFKATGDESYQKKSDLGMKFVMERCPKEAKMCQWHFFPLYVYYQDTKDKRYLDGMLKVSDELLGEKSFNDFVDTNTGIKLAMLYEATGDVKYRDRLEKAAKEALSLNNGTILEVNDNRVIYEVRGLEIRARSISTIWSVILPAYRITGKSEYLETARDFFNRAALASNAEFYARGVRGVPSLIKAIESLVELSELDKESGGRYLEEAQAITQTLITGQLDSAEDPKFTGDYGLLMIPGIDPGSKDTLYSGWLSRLLVKMANQKFQL